MDERSSSPGLLSPFTVVASLLVNLSFFSTFSFGSVFGGCWKG